MQLRPTLRRLPLGFPDVRAAFAALSMLLAGIAPASAQTITTIAGGATCNSASALAVSVPPGASAVDAAGNVFVVVSQSHMVCRIATNGAISRVAGNGTEGFSGDGGAATAAQLRYPNGIAVDAGGNLYISDTFNSRIRKVTAAGTISTIAGDGSQTFGGDGGPASAAQLNFPAGIALDGSGNLYFADSSNNRIRKIAGGNISTVAGNGNPGYSGDGGAATDAWLRSPWGIAVDATGANLYIADRLNHRIRKVAGGNISTFAGNGANGYSGDGGAATAAELFTPHGVAVDAAGNVYIADTQNNRLRKVAAANGNISTLAGSDAAAFGGDGGPAAAATLNYVQDVAIDGSGNLYLSDVNNSRLRKITAADGKIATLAGNGSEGYGGDGGPGTSAQLGSYLHVASDAAGNVYISDTNNHRVRKLATDGTISTVAGNGSKGYSGDAGPATAAQLYSPNGIALDGNNNLYIADSNNHCIRKVAADGTISTVAGNGNFGNGGDNGLATAANLAWPADVAVDSVGILYIADGGNNRIRKVSTTGYIATVAGDGTWGSGGDGGPALSAQFKQPSGVVVDLSGNLLIADTANNRIRKLTTGGTIVAFAGNGAPGWDGDGGPAVDAKINIPRGLAIDPLGNVVIAQGYDNRVRKVVADGTISKIAGVGQAGFEGDGGPALAALLNESLSVAFDAAGNMYIADSGNRRIRKVASSLAATTTTLSSSANPSVHGQGVTLTATVGGASPTGTVTFAEGAAVLCNVVALSANKATCAVPASALGTGNHDLHASYSGDVANAASIGLLTQTVSKASTAIEITNMTPGSIVLGQSAKMTSSLAVTSPGAGTPSGTITVSDGEVSCSYSTPASDNCSITPTSTGARTITATYSGDGNFATSTTTSQYLLVNVAPVAGTCGADNGQTLLAAPTHLCSAGIAGAINGSGHPWSWSCVGLNGGGNAICSATIKTWTVTATADANGAITPASQAIDHGQSATLTVTPQSGYSAQVSGCGGSLSGSVYTTGAITADCAISATFTADPVAGTCGADNGQTLLAAPTHLCSAGNAGAINGTGHPWSWTCVGMNGGGNATCSATIKTWTVTATAGANGSITPTSQTVDHGQSATLTVTPQSGYNAQVDGCGGSLNGATYATGAVTGDCAIVATFSAVPRTLTTTALSLTPNPVMANQAVTATVTVTSASQPTGVSHSASAQALPTAVSGSVVVSGGGQQCTAMLSGNGSGSCALSYATPGSYAVAANYSGDTQNAPSSASANLTVNAVPQPAAAIPAPALSWWATLAMIAALAAFARRSIAKI